MLFEGNITFDPKFKSRTTADELMVVSQDASYEMGKRRERGMKKRGGVVGLLYHQVMADDTAILMNGFSISNRSYSRFGANG